MRNKEDCVDKPMNEEHDDCVRCRARFTDVASVSWRYYEYAVVLFLRPVRAQRCRICRITRTTLNYS